MTGWAWLYAFAGALLAGAIAYGVIVTYRRRRHRAAQLQSEEATKKLYDAETRREQR